MKTYFSAARMFFIFALTLITLGSYAQEFTKVFQQQYNVDRGAVLVVQNKFGEIRCQSWEESSISIKATVKVEAGSQEKANKVFEKIIVKLTGTRSRVEGITTVNTSGNGKFSIDYDIRLPKWVKLELDNKFGDIVLDETVETARINLEYGSMKANAFSGPENVMTIKFSDVNAGFIQSGRINLEYGKWRSENTGNVTLKTRFSEVNLLNSANLNIDSQYDEYSIGSSGSLIAVTRFTSLDLGKINGSFDLDLQYGSLTAAQISPDFSTGKIRNTFTNVSLGFDPGSSFRLEAELQFGDLSYPKSNTSLSKETVGYTTNIYKGRVGAAQNPAATLSIIARNANADIKFTK